MSWHDRVRAPHIGLTTANVHSPSPHPYRRTLDFLERTAAGHVAVLLRAAQTYPHSKVPMMRPAPLSERQLVFFIRETLDCVSQSRTDHHASIGLC
jgi:hypothetical protein